MKFSFFVLLPASLLFLYAVFFGLGSAAVLLLNEPWQINGDYWRNHLMNAVVAFVVSMLLYPVGNKMSKKEFMKKGDKEELAYAKRAKETHAKHKEIDRMYKNGEIDQYEYSAKMNRLYPPTVQEPERVYICSACGSEHCNGCG